MRRLDRLIPPFASFLIRTIHSTMRIRHVESAEVDRIVGDGKYYILAFWHAHLLLMVYARYNPPIVAMISRHRDGELIAKTVARFGAASVRGSSTRGGGAALRAMILAARDGATLAITPDGPKGPRHVAQMGVVQAAQATRLPIVPAAFIPHRRVQLRSWDRFEIPYLFTRGIFLYGASIEVPRRMDREEMEAQRRKVEGALRELSERGEREFDSLWAGEGN